MEEKFVQKIQATWDESEIGTRIESGSLQINDDWPMLVMRGDNTFGINIALTYLLEALKDKDLKEMGLSPLDILQLEAFKDMLNDVIV